MSTSSRAIAPKAAIVGIAGLRLDPAEVELFRHYPPLGVILFARNIQGPDQLSTLMAELRAALPADAIFMVDQEGGRVARLRPPRWLGHPPARTIGARFADDPAAGLRAAWLTGALIGLDCRSAGFTMAAAPVLDIAVPDAHDVIGDRSFAADPVTVARLGRAVAQGLLAAGVLPVAKHVPGHGRAQVDSHLALPEVPQAELTADIRPFMLNVGLPWMMTAHIVYRAVDPELPATLSARVIQSVIRAQIGFKGVLVTDDLAMKALSGFPYELARRALDAGCDVALYCSGDFASTEALLRTCPPLTPEASERVRSADRLAQTQRQTLDVLVLRQERDRLLA